MLKFLLKLVSFDFKLKLVNGSRRIQKDPKDLALLEGAAIVVMSHVVPGPWSSWPYKSSKWACGSQLVLQAIAEMVGIPTISYSFSVILGEAQGTLSESTPKSKKEWHCVVADFDF